MAALTDAELVLRLGDTDRAALTELYRRHGRPCYALARRVCAGDEAAEQVVLEAFLTLWRDPPGPDATNGGFATWLLTLTHRLAVDARRSDRPPGDGAAPEPGTSEPGAPATEPGQPGAAAPGEPGAGPAERGCPRLTAEQRVVLGLAYFGGRTQREIAALTGVAVSTVKSRMFAGVQRLRALLDDQDGRDAIAAEGRAIGEVNR